MNINTSAAGSGPAPVGSAMPPRVKSREIRVGLVMYGGVSLAVYISGVAHEFFNAVRGRGVYRLLKALTDSDVVVDVISGTSAGGINGILLGYALCNEREFASCADLWREHGDIARLLRDPGKAGQATYSLLNSENYYQPRLAGAFAGMAPIGRRMDEDASSTQELDLFVTGTEVEGRRYTVLDDAGRAVDVKDHRTVFLLKHRAGRRQPFAPDFNAPGLTPALQANVTHEALAKLGRITSCFPVAFAPVQVSHVPKSKLDDNAGTGARVDALLTEWGALRRDSCFLDGGVLDNKPFTYTVREIFQRTAEREVSRRLFYIEPDPEQFREATSGTQPNVVKAAAVALLGIPGYESISEDLKLLADRNSKIHTYKRLAEALAQTGRGAQAPATTGTADAVYRRSRLVALSQRVVRGLLRVDGDDQLLDVRLRRKAEFLFSEFDQMAENAGLGDMLLSQYDIYFRLRRLFDLVYYACDDGRYDPRRPEFLWVINRQIKLLDIVRNAMEQLIDEVNFDWAGKPGNEVWVLVGQVFSHLLASNPAGDPVPAGYGSTRDDEVVRTLLGTLNETLRKRIVAIKAAMAAGTLGALPAGVTNLLQEADAYELRTLQLFPLQASAWDELPIVRYQRFDRIDAALYPLEMFGDVNEKDEIRTVRISPVDAQRGFSRRDSAEKTAGQTLFHFGGFFKRSWRSNDILCGRLDAIAQILEEFFDKERIAAMATDSVLGMQLKARLGGDLDPASLFPNAGASTQAALRTWLDGLVARDAAAYEPQAFESNLTLLVEAAQLEVLHEDLPKLAADEQYELQEWEAGDVHATSPLSSAADAERTAMQKLAGTATPTAIAPAGPRETTMGRFFVRHGRVAGGKSVVAAIPPLVLLEMLARTLLVTRDALLTSFGAHAAAVRASVAYKWLDRGLRVFHGAVVFFRREPVFLCVAMGALAAASLVALAVGVVWWDELVHPVGKNLHLPAFTLLVLVPITALLWQMSCFRWPTWTRRLAAIAVVTVVALGVFLLLRHWDAAAGNVGALLRRWGDAISIP